MQLPREEQLEFLILGLNVKNKLKDSQVQNTKNLELLKKLRDILINSINLKFPILLFKINKSKLSFRVYHKKVHMNNSLKIYH